MPGYDITFPIFYSSLLHVSLKGPRTFVSEETAPLLTGLPAKFHIIHGKVEFPRFADIIKLLSCIKIFENPHILISEQYLNQITN